MLNGLKVDIVKIDELIRQRKIEEVLDIVDKELLIKQLKFSISDVQRFRNIWKKLSKRRSERNK